VVTWTPATSTSPTAAGTGFDRLLETIQARRCPNVIIDIKKFNQDNAMKSRDAAATFEAGDQ